MARHGENIYKRKDGRYEGRYVIGKKCDGSTRFGYIYGSRYIEVKMRLLEKKAEIQRAAHPEATAHGITIEKWMRHWLEADVRGAIKASSYMAYQNQLNRHILPYLGKTDIAAVTPGTLHLFLQYLKEKGLGDSTVKGIYRLLSSAMRAALEEGLIGKNPCRKIRAIQAERPRQRVLSREEQMRLEKALKEKKDLTALFAMYTGLRLGEICGLKWSDIDWENGTATVCRTVQRLKQTSPDGIMTQKRGKTCLTVGSPKSYSSCRTIPVPAFLLKRLEEQIERKTDCERDLGYVFGVEMRAADPRTVQRRFEQIIKSLGIAGFHFHTLRHSYATRLFEMGVDVKTISQLLGHSSSKMTLDCYVHSHLDRQRSAIARLAACANL